MNNFIMTGIDSLGDIIIKSTEIMSLLNQRSTILGEMLLRIKQCYPHIFNECVTRNDMDELDIIAEKLDKIKIKKII